MQMVTQQVRYASEHHFLFKKDLKNTARVPFQDSVPFIRWLESLQVTGKPTSLIVLYENNKNHGWLKNESLKNISQTKKRAVNEGAN